VNFRYSLEPWQVAQDISDTASFISVEAGSQIWKAGFRRQRCQLVGSRDILVPHAEQKGKHIDRIPVQVQYARLGHEVWRALIVKYTVVLVFGRRTTGLDLMRRERAKVASGNCLLSRR
jgi:hypothetical protein